MTEIHVDIPPPLLSLLEAEAERRGTTVPGALAAIAEEYFQPAPDSRLEAIRGALLSANSLQGGAEAEEFLLAEWLEDAEKQWAGDTSATPGPVTSVDDAEAVFQRWMLDHQGDDLDEI